MFCRGRHNGPLLAISDINSPPSKSITAASFYNSSSKTSRVTKRTEVITVTEQVFVLCISIMSQFDVRVSVRLKV